MERITVQPVYANLRRFDEKSCRAYTTMPKLQNSVQKAHQRLHSWRKVGVEFGVKCATARRVALGIEPSHPAIRHALGLPAYAPAPCCIVCGEVHTTKRCTKVKRQVRDLFSLPVEELTRMMKERVDF